MSLLQTEDINHRKESHSAAYFRQVVEPGMVKDGRRDTWVGVGNLFDLIRQPEHHFSQQLRVGFKHISSMSLKGGEKKYVYIHIPFTTITFPAIKN